MKKRRPLTISQDIKDQDNTTKREYVMYHLSKMRGRIQSTVRNWSSSQHMMDIEGLVFEQVNRLIISSGKLVTFTKVPFLLHLTVVNDAITAKLIKPL